MHLFNGVHVQSAFGQKPISNSNEQVKQVPRVSSLVPVLIVEMSVPFAPQAILILSASVDTELCAQQDQHYCEMCWFRPLVQFFTPSLSHSVNSSGRLADHGNRWER